MAKGKIKVQSENIFPIIKKFLYSDHEIFLRELVSNAIDATNKLKALAEMGELKGDIGKPIIEVKIDEKNKRLHIIDRGIGMTAEEVKKYINEVAFSGAAEFVEQYRDKSQQTHAMIGHFGLGFYSAFMVADKVEIRTRSHRDEPAVYWSCDGTTAYNLKKGTKTERGTEVILHIDEENEEFLQRGRIAELLNKYNQFAPVPIKFGSREETVKEGGKEKKIEVDNIVNNPEPAWTQSPKDLTDEDYVKFYRELYPMQLDKPLFWIHLNVDYPFKLTGILYFPKIKSQLQPVKDKIQLYQNQIFVTDNVEGIAADFLTLMRGVIDSPDIPLNVSRSYLQADVAVKKISGYITRKVADKLSDIFKNNRGELEKKWSDIKVIIEYGMLTDGKFFEKAKRFSLYQNTAGQYFTLGEFTDKIRDGQTDTAGKLIYLYATDRHAQHSYIASAQAKGYDVLLLDSPLTAHFIQKLEADGKDISFVRVDADSIDKLIKKAGSAVSKLSEKEREKLKSIIEENAPEKSFTIQLEALDSDVNPFVITIPEFMRRMKEINQTGAGMLGMENLPESYNLIVNTNSNFVARILKTESEEARKELITQALDLARLSQNLLKGESLTQFIKRSFELI
ncbi:MAG: molecular chaperone HtpG [Flavobacteriales bacterium]